ncbi:hypothetical protein DOY81_013004 [Sarcophaga bullata]|nr:hypothetical protein DOY81_013004 [Sarcophaga bullata]
MMDEQLIDEVALHAVIYNRQKYYLNGSNGNGPVSANKYETKDEAWSSIAMKLRSDVETCKKRWKYLRERYVSQRKQGDPPVYEHLSRPYLEKMKFLDSHIQPRKSYRNVPNFLTSPHSANSSNFNDYNMDSKSNSSMKSIGHFGQHSHHFQDQQHAMNALSSAAAAASAIEGDSRVKLEADQVFRDFAAAVASQHLQQISQTQMHQQSVAAAMAADSPQSYNEHFREAAGSALSAVVGGSTMNGSSGNGCGGNSGIHSSSSSIKSPLSSPLGVSNHHNGSAGAGHSSSTVQPAVHNSSSTVAGNGGGSGGGGSNNSNHHFNSHSFSDTNNDDLDSAVSINYNTKKPRVQLNNSTTSPQLHNSNNNNSHHNSHNNLNANNNNAHFGDDSEDEDTDDNSSSMLQPQTILNEHHTAENPFQTMSASTSGVTAAAVLQRSHSNSSMNNTSNNNNNHSNNSQTPSSNMFSSNADFLFQLYQQLPQHHHTHQQQHNSNVGPSQQFNKFQVPPTPQPTLQRSSEHLLGELVTTELLKMSKERRKNVQKRILEILFFDD